MIPTPYGANSLATSAGAPARLVIHETPTGALPGRCEDRSSGSRVLRESNPYNLSVIKLFKSHKHAYASTHFLERGYHPCPTSRPPFIQRSSTIVAEMGVEPM